MRNGVKMINELDNLRDKYLHDVTYISDYVQYLETFFLASIRMIEHLETVTPTLSKSPNIINLCDHNSVIQREMVQHLQHIEAEMRSLNIKAKDPNEPCGEDPTPEGDVIFYLICEIRKGENNPKKLFETAQNNITAMCMMKGDDVGFEGYNLLNDNPSRVRKLVELALAEETRRKYKTLNAEHSYIKMSAKSLELFDSANPINLYKQNFIQIMAYFDSCIFDMVGFCIEQNFFDWLAYFDNVNIKTHDMAACRDFEIFKANQIESSLKKCYVKDLLNILHSQYNQAFEINGIDNYPLLQEMIGRRNVHIHHNGVVDKMYLDNFNIFKVSSGDYLTINKEYFENAVDITKKLVASIASTCI